MKSRFAGKVASQAAVQKARSSSFGYLSLPQGWQMFKEYEGIVKLDFLPYIITVDNHPDRVERDKTAFKGDQWYRRSVKVHRNIGAENKKYVCPLPKPCPIDKFRQERVRDGAGKDQTAEQFKKELAGLRASDRSLYIVVPIGVKKYEEMPYLWDISDAGFQYLLNDELKVHPEYEIFPDLEVGYTLEIRFSLKAIEKNDFICATRIDFLKREQQYDESWLKKMPNLDEIPIVLGYKELEHIFYETDEEEEETTSEPAEQAEIRRELAHEEAPAPTRRRLPPGQEAAPPTRAEIVDPEPEKEKEPEPPKRTRRMPPGDSKPAEKAPEPPKAAEKGKCPSKHEFGKDCDEFPKDCQDCPEWSPCFDAQKELKRAARGK